METEASLASAKSVDSVQILQNAVSNHAYQHMFSDISTGSNFKMNLFKF